MDYCRLQHLLQGVAGWSDDTERNVTTIPVEREVLGFSSRFDEKFLNGGIYDLPIDFRCPNR